MAGAAEDRGELFFWLPASSATDDWMFRTAICVLRNPCATALGAERRCDSEKPRRILAKDFLLDFTGDAQLADAV